MIGIAHILVAFSAIKVIELSLIGIVVGEQAFIAGAAITATIMFWIYWSETIEPRL